MMIILKKMRILIIVVFGISSVYASTGGTKISYAQYPYLATYVEFDGSTHKITNWCVTTLINSTTAITAAHCVLLYPDPKVLHAVMNDNNQVLVKQAYPDNAYNDQILNELISPYDISLVTLKEPTVSTIFLALDTNFDPYSYINNQPGQEVLFPYFGVNENNPVDPEDPEQINTGTLSIMSGSKCLEQTEDLINNEGSKFPESILIDLKDLVKSLTVTPQEYFCVFNKKSDPIHSTPGDSGSPLVIDYESKPTIAGLLSQSTDISASQQYTDLILYDNIANSYNFIKSCNSPKKLSVKNQQNNSVCNTATQWWIQKHTVSSDQPIFVVRNVIEEGLVWMVPDLNSSDINNMIVMPYYLKNRKL